MEITLLHGGTGIARVPHEGMKMGWGITTQGDGCSEWHPSTAYRRQQS